jgi:hypothetical protein
MAGGIDWFRWHHGSVTDPKFQLVARKSGASLPDVLAVWSYVLEQASANQARGCYGEIDCEAVDCLFNFPATEGRTADVLNAMVARGLLADGFVANWEKRQPKREDATCAERKRRQREREHELQMAGAVTPETPRNVTQGHAQVTHGHDRGEERREEEIKTRAENGASPPFPPPAREPDLSGHEPTPAGLLCRAIKAAGVADVNPGHADLLRLMAGGITTESFTATAAELAGKGKGKFALLLKTVEGRWNDAQCAPAIAQAAAMAPGVSAVAQTAALLAQQAEAGRRANSPEARAARLAAMARLHRENS